MNPTNENGRIGFGCAGIPGALSRREAEALIETVLDSGVSHFDVARMYGAGAAERVLGGVARGRRRDMFIVSKAGIEPSRRHARWTAKLTGGALRLPGAHAQFGRFAASQVRASLNTSLRELQVDHLDALLLHEIEPQHVTDDLRWTLETLQRDGKFEAYGIATSIEHTLPLLTDYPDLCGIVQVSAAWLDAGRPAPPDSTLIIHSVLGERLSRAFAAINANPDAQLRFTQATGADAQDRAALAGLMLQSACRRNPNGVTLFSSASREHVVRNAAVLAKAGGPADALDAFLAGPPGGRAASDVA